MPWLDTTSLAGLSGPQAGAQTSSSGGWYDPSKPWDASNPLAGVKPLTNLQYVPERKFLARDASGDMTEQVDPAYVLSSNGTRLPATTNPDGTVSFSDQYQDPAGASVKDKLNASYTMDPKTGTAIPTAAAHQYQASNWVSNGQPLATVIAALGAAYAGGAALAANGAGGAGAGAGATAGAGTGGGAAGAGAGTGGLTFSGNAGGLSLGVGAEGSAAAQAGAMAGAEAGAGTAAGAGAGGMSSADLAALYGNTGYAGSAGATAADAGFAGMGATTAGGAAGGSGSALSSLAAGNYGDALSSFGTSAGNYLSSPSGLQSLVGLGASLYGANKQSDAANRAAQMSMDQYNQTRADNAPYRQAGYQALGTIGDLMGTSGNTSAANYGSLTHQFNASDLNANLAPNWKFQLDQGVGATTNAANASGFSGNALKGINDYAQNYAGNAYQQAFNNYTANQTNTYNRLSNLAGLGQTSNQITANSGANATNQAGNYVTSGAAANAAGYVGGANAINNGINNYQGWNYLYGSQKP